MAAYFLGIDNGGTVTKAAVYDTDGDEVSAACMKTETLYSHPAHIERDMDEFWPANVQVNSESMRSIFATQGEMPQ